MADLKDKVVLITGSSAGIGEGIAIEFAKFGSKLTLTGRNKENLQNVATKCMLNGLDKSKILCIHGDITSSDLRRDLIKRTIDTYGRLDVLVNNAGLTHFRGPCNTTTEQFDEIMNVNVKSVFFLTQLAIPHLKETKGNIINISSITGVLAWKRLTAYCMSKAELDMYTRCLSIELGPYGIRANAVSPGIIVSMIGRRGDSAAVDDNVYEESLVEQAKRHPIGRVGYPDDVASAVLFLASDERSPLISGHIMMVDGARHCSSVGIEK